MFESAVRANPLAAQLWAEKGRAHKELAQTEEALQALLRAVALEE